MKTKKVMILSFCAVALLAVFVGICFLFFGLKTVQDVPSGVEIQTIDCKPHLKTEYGGREYSYVFKLEQKFDDEFVVVDTVESKTNILNLYDCKLVLVSGQTYRFSACFKYESSTGAFSQCLEWTY